MILKFAPRRALADWLRDGWSPVPGYEYRPGEYAFLLMAEDVKRSRVEARTLASKLQGVKRKKISNYSAATRCRKTHGSRRSSQKWEDFRAKMMCELRA